MSETIQTKRCSKCKQIKPVSEFNKNRSGKDGLHNQCKVCLLENIKKYQKTEKGKATQQAAIKRYKQSKKGKARDKRYNQSEKGKAMHREAAKRFFARNPNQMKAVKAVNEAIRIGKLPRPDTLLCHYGDHPAEQYHHWSYLPEHWLDVVPVCRKCHKRVC